MNIKDLITKLQMYKNHDLKVLITVGDEDNDAISTSEFELLNKDETYDYIEIFVNQTNSVKQV